MILSSQSKPHERSVLAFAATCGNLRRVKLFRARAFLTSRYPLAILAGLLWAGAFPKIGIAGLAWVAPAAMLGAASGTNRSQRFRIGYVAGLAYYLASLYWLLFIPYRWHGLPLAPALGWIVLSAYLALYPAIWVVLVRAPSSDYSTAGSPESNLSAVASAKAEAQSPESEMKNPTWLRRTLWALGGAAVWVGLEMIIGRLFSGFPWDPLGASQYQMLPLIQMACITGVFGVSFLVVWGSLALLSASRMLLRRPSARSVWLADMALPLLIVALLFNLGLRRLRNELPSDRAIKVTFVQPSIPQTLIWDSERSDERFQELLALTRQALTDPTDLLLWPEAAVPKMIRYHDDMLRPLAEMAVSNHIWMIIGSDDKQPKLNTKDPEEAIYFNSCFLINPQGDLADRYCKRNLVIFGEYLPLERWLPFLDWFVPDSAWFTPGDRTGQFKLSDLRVNVSPLICFEDTFPATAREATQKDTDLLVNLTNNGWFDESAAQWQHTASALFRAVENGLPLLRCSNNGLTCWVDSCGRLRQIFSDNSGSVYGPGFMTAEIPLPRAGMERTPTFYHEHGDWFGWLCVGVMAIWSAMMGRAAWERRRLRRRVLVSHGN